MDEYDEELSVDYDQDEYDTDVNVDIDIARDDQQQLFLNIALDIQDYCNFYAVPIFNKHTNIVGLVNMLTNINQ